MVRIFFSEFREDPVKIDIIVVPKTKNEMYLNIELSSNKSNLLKLQVSPNKRGMPKTPIKVGKRQREKKIIPVREGFQQRNTTKLSG